MSASGAENKPRAVEQPTDQPSTAASETTAVFPAVVNRFVKLNKADQKTFAKTFRGLALSGMGSVFNVSDCDSLDDSALWGLNCVKVVLDNGGSRVVIYFDEKRRAVLSRLRTDRSVAFMDCTANSVKDWGFGPVVTCDMR